MSPALKELLFTIRQHPAFPEMMKYIETPTIKPFRETDDPVKHQAHHIHRSGRRLQHEIWRQFLIGEPTSEQEKS